MFVYTDFNYILRARAVTSLICIWEYSVWVLKGAPDILMIFRYYLVLNSEFPATILQHYTTCFQFARHIYSLMSSLHFLVQFLALLLRIPDVSPRRLFILTDFFVDFFSPSGKYFKQASSSKSGMINLLSRCATLFHTWKKTCSQVHVLPNELAKFRDNARNSANLDTGKETWKVIKASWLKRLQKNLATLKFSKFKLQFLLEHQVFRRIMGFQRYVYL